MGLVIEHQVYEQQKEILNIVQEFEFNSSRFKMQLKHNEIDLYKKLSCIRSMAYFSNLYSGKYISDEDILIFGGQYQKKLVGLYVITRKEVSFYYFKNDVNPRIYSTLEISKGKELLLYRNRNHFHVLFGEKKNNKMKKLKLSKKDIKGSLTKIQNYNIDLTSSDFHRSVDLLLLSMVRQSATYYLEVKEQYKKRVIGKSLKLTPLNFIGSLRSCEKIYEKTYGETLKNGFQFAKTIFSSDLVIPYARKN